MDWTRDAHQAIKHRARTLRSVALLRVERGGSGPETFSTKPIAGFDGCVQDEELGWMAFQELYIDRCSTERCREELDR